MRIGVVHATLNAVKPLVNAFHELDTEIEICNFVNEELLYQANLSGGVESRGLRSFYRTFMQAAEASVDGIVIACSLYSSYVQTASQLTKKPVIAIDQPMVENAVEKGKKIGILATTVSAGPAEEKKILQEAQRVGKNVETEVIVVPEAFVALKEGKEDLHNELLKEAAVNLKAHLCDTVVLSQITMACARPEIENLGIKVLDSPSSGARSLIRQIKF